VSYVDTQWIRKRSSIGEKAKQKQEILHTEYELQTRYWFHTVQQRFT